jgi:hypothetical protein
MQVTETNPDGPWQWAQQPTCQICLTVFNMYASNAPLDLRLVGGWLKTVQLAGPSVAAAAAHHS